MKRTAVSLAISAALIGGGVVAVAVTNGSQAPAGATASRAADDLGSAPPDARPRGDHLPVTQPGEPCAEARHASSVAGLATAIPIWEPVGERLTGAWTCGDVPVLMYGGVQVTFETGYARVDPATKFPRMVATDDGHVQTINGRLAYVHPADARGPRNGVWILAGDYSIGLTAKPEVGIARVLQVANEIHIPSAAGG